MFCVACGVRLRGFGDTKGKTKRHYCSKCFKTSQGIFCHNWYSGMYCFTAQEALTKPDSK